MLSHNPYPISIDLQQHDSLRSLENVIQYGFPMLLQNQEELDPSLAPVLLLWLKYKKHIKLTFLTLTASILIPNTHNSRHPLNKLFSYLISS